MTLQERIESYISQTKFPRSLFIGDEDQGNYIGVNFYDKKAGVVETLHPTSEVQYLETFGKIRGLTKSQEKYRQYLRSDCGLTFIEWLTDIYPKYYMK